MKQKAQLLSFLFHSLSFPTLAVMTTRTPKRHSAHITGEHSVLEPLPSRRSTIPELNIECIRSQAQQCPRHQHAEEFVQEICTTRLAQETCTSDVISCPSFFYRAMLCRAQLWHSTSSVCLWHSDMLFIGWNTWEIISRPNSLRHMLRLSPTRTIWSNGNTPKLGRNRGGDRSWARQTQNISDKTVQGYYDKLIGSRIRAFDWVPK